MEQPQAAAANDEDYFALKIGPKFIEAARQCERNWLWVAQDRGLWRLWWLIYCQTQGIDPGTGEQNANQEIKFIDEEARYMSFRVQLTRVLIQQKLMLAQDERPSFEAVASNNDASSLAKVNMGSKAIDYVLTDAKLEQRASGALESNGYFGAGGLHLSWNYGGGKLVDAQEPDTDPDGNELQMPDPEAGPELSPETGEPVLDEAGEPVPKMKTMMRSVKKRSGAPKIDKLYAWQQCTDPYQEEDHSWVIIKTPVNKYELAAPFKTSDPVKYAAIIGCTIDEDLGDDALFAWGNRNSVSSDIIVLRTLYHRNCEAVEGGRFAQWCQNVGIYGCDEMLPCPLDEGLPWEPVIAGRYFCTAFGYPESSDLLAVQSALNEVMSQTLTLVQKHGNPNTYKRDDVQIDEAAFQAGGAMFDLPPGAKPPETTKYDDMGDAPKFLVEFCQKVMPLMMGLNPTVQGTPEANIQSGTFGVLLVNLAQKFANQMQQAYDFAITGIANKSLELVKKNATNGFWAKVAGISDSPYFEMFKTEDLTDFREVTVKRRNPIMSTLMGRMEIYNATKDLLKPQRAEAMELLLDSRTDAYAENDQSATIRIRKENEQMLRAVGDNFDSMPQDPMMQAEWFKQIAPKVSWSDPWPIECAKHIAERDKLRSQDPPEDPRAYAIWIATINLFDYHTVDHSNVAASNQMPLNMVAGLPIIPVGPNAPPPPEPGGKPGKPGGGGSAKTPASGGSSMAPSSNDPAEPAPPKSPQPPPAAEGAAAGLQ